MAKKKREVNWVFGDKSKRKKISFYGLVCRGPYYFFVLKENSLLFLAF
ncbi:MAG: hypothetical protein MR687_09545 [Spirochaetales bacterium]|nr:hypothetical protein [Spirochaetales bacterium]